MPAPRIAIPEPTSTDPASPRRRLLRALGVMFMLLAFLEAGVLDCGWSGSLTTNGILPATIEGVDSVIVFGSSAGGYGRTFITVLRRDNQVVTFNEQIDTSGEINSGDFRSIHGVNYLFAVNWGNSHGYLINYDSGAIQTLNLSAVTGSEAAGFDAKFLSDNTVVLADGPDRKYSVISLHPLALLWQSPGMRSDYVTSSVFPYANGLNAIVTDRSKSGFDVGKIYSIPLTQTAPADFVPRTSAAGLAATGASAWYFDTSDLPVGGGQLADAKILPNGNLLYAVCRNSDASKTGVAEIDPVTRSTVFSWNDPGWRKDDDGVPAGPESVWKYPNGNYLIATVDGGPGRVGAAIYEMKPDHTVVWKYNGNYAAAVGATILPAH